MLLGSNTNKTAFIEVRIACEKAIKLHLTITEQNRCLVYVATGVIKFVSGILTEKVSLNIILCEIKEES